MNNILIKYFEVISFILWIFAWLSVNWITYNLNLNIWISLLFLILSIVAFIYWFRQKNKITSFEYNIEDWEWQKELIYDKEVWICKNNPMFQIKKWSDYEEFSETWTQVYPNSKWSSRYSVELLSNWVIIKTFNWVFCDWWNINVPMPRMQNLDESNFTNPKIIYYWKRDSIEFKLARIIGRFYIYKNIEWVAKFSNIEIR